jgi:hypothetical protein
MKRRDGSAATRLKVATLFHVQFIRLVNNENTPRRHECQVLRRFPEIVESGGFCFVFHTLREGGGRLVLFRGSRGSFTPL